MNQDEANVVSALLDAYRRGFFPMADPGQEDLQWFNPDPRGIIPLEPGEGLHIPRRLRDRVRSGRFELTTDAAFGAVMRGCAMPRGSDRQTWIDGRIIGAYTALHRAGHAHSIEAWLPGGTAGRTLVGGLYGVHIGGAFFAESKFHVAGAGGTDASKVCLVHLIAHLRRRGFALLDTQFWNPHIDQFGCREIPRAEYLHRLERALAPPVLWLPFEPERDRESLSRWAGARSGQ